MFRYKLLVIIPGILICLFFTGRLVFAKQGTEVIEAIYNDIKLYVDGLLITPKDKDGSIVEPFIYNGTVYLPLHAIGEAFGEFVEWDGSTFSVYVGERNDTDKYLSEHLVAYQVGGNGYYPYAISDGKSFSLSGIKYYRGVVGANHGGGPGWGLYNLNGQFKSISGIIGHVDGTNTKDSVVKFYLDGKLKEEYYLKGDDLAQSFTIDVSGALQMKIEFGMGSTDGQYALADVIVK